MSDVLAGAVALVRPGPLEQSVRWGGLLLPALDGHGWTTPAALTGLALAAGVTFRRGFVNVPFNVAVVPSRAGTRVSILTGFNIRRR